MKLFNRYLLAAGSAAMLALGSATMSEAAITTTNLIANLDARDYNDGAGNPADDTNLNAPPDGWDDLTGLNDFNGLVGSPTYQSAGPETLNGNPSVQYSNGGGELHFENFGFSGDQAHNMFFVVRLNSNWNSLILLESNDLNVKNEGYTIHQSGATGVVMEGGFGDNLTFDLGSGVIGEAIILEVQYAGGGWNGTNLNVFVNGNEVAVSGGSGDLLAFAGGAGENTALGSAFGRSINTHLGQFLMYDAALSDEDRNATGLQLATEWGIETSYIPEPASAALLGIGGLLLAGRRRSA